MKATRLKWAIEYNVKHDWLQVELLRGNGPFFSMTWSTIGINTCFRFSQNHKVEGARALIRAMKRDLLMSFIHNTTVKTLLDEVIAAESGMVTATELKDAANALRRLDDEEAG